MGSLAYLTKFGTSGPNLLKNLATTGKYVDDVNDVSKVVYATATGQDPTSALQNLVFGQDMGFGFGKASDYMNAKFGRSGTPDLEVYLPGGLNQIEMLMGRGKMKHLEIIGIRNIEQ